MKDDRVYRTEFRSYALWLGLLGLPLIPIAAVLVRFGWVQFQAKGMVPPSVLCLLVLVVVFIWLSRYQLTFSSSDITYRSWRKSWTVSYANIAEVSASRVAPISQAPIGAYIHFKDGRRELIYTKAFPMAAIRDLFALGAAA
ncbi:hypothetical protein H9L17_04965 [Thermomonas brevis]|uniref:PH domain-containing protein n=1 Tax=Thermomonas brevis TaxID=215691 RepID=A0A7G9QVW7_9GAMM|nr:hypothetical protein [Thermomonas brevis]QNN47492.1 hypothetical protein H9L17_04965 [Thermomonas brevis]